MNKRVRDLNIEIKLLKDRYEALINENTTLHNDRTKLIKQNKAYEKIISVIRTYEKIISVITELLRI